MQVQLSLPAFSGDSTNPTNFSGACHLQAKMIQYKSKENNNATRSFDITHSKTFKKIRYALDVQTNYHMSLLSPYLLLYHLQ